MRINLPTPEGSKTIDLQDSIDLSLPFDYQLQRERAWYIGPMKREAVVLGDWKGSVELGGQINFYNLMLNPHAHGTHTESLSHVEGGAIVLPTISKAFLHSLLITLPPTGSNEALDLKQCFVELEKSPFEALILRTLPNELDKKEKFYSATHPPYLKAEDAARLAQMGIQHLLIDLPSVDQEEDAGALAAHKAFWGLPHQPRPEATITELIYVPNDCLDGTFALSLHTAPIINDAVPSRPLIYRYL